MRNDMLRRAIRAVTRNPFGGSLASYNINGSKLVEKTGDGMTLSDSFTITMLDAELEVSDALELTEAAFEFASYSHLLAEDELELSDQLATIARTTSTAILEGDGVSLADDFALIVLDAELALTDAEAFTLTDDGPTIDSVSVHNTLTDANVATLTDLGVTIWAQGDALEILNGDFGDSYLWAGRFTYHLPVSWRTYSWEYDSFATPDAIAQTFDVVDPNLACEATCLLYVKTISSTGMDARWKGSGIRQSTTENPGLAIADGTEYSLGFKYKAAAYDISLKLEVRIIDSRGYVWDDTAGNWSTTWSTISKLLSPTGDYQTAAITFTGAADGPLAIEIHAAQTLTGYAGGLRYVELDDVTLVEV